MSMDNKKDNAEEVVARDITERKKAEEALQESEEKYKALFEKSGNAIFIFDTETMLILDANPAMSTTYGYSYEELIGMNCLELSAEVEKSIHAKATVDKVGRVSVTLRMHKKKDGTVFPLELDVYSIGLNEKAIGYTVIKDITERKQAEDTLKKHAAELERVNRVFVGRELKMAELKKEIEELKKNQKS